jgi:hypothetical protein
MLLIGVFQSWGIHGGVKGSEEAEHESNDGCENERGGEGCPNGVVSDLRFWSAGRNHCQPMSMLTYLVCERI